MVMQEFHELPHSSTDETVQSERVLPALAVNELWWRYPTFSDQPADWILRDISLQVQPGECFGITGPSGAGKTTFCRTLLGILPQNARLNDEQLPQHFQGSVLLHGQPVTEQTANARQIGMVMQDPENQFLRMSLFHELGMGLQIQGVPNDDILQRSYEALSWVGLSHLWHGAAYIHPADLSGGQKQRVAIASFLALRPRLLILDEPTSDLDPVGKREVIETIARLRRDYRMTIILVEQDPEILSAFCDRIALLAEGRVELIAPPGEFYQQQMVLEQCGATVGELARLSWATGYTLAGKPPLTLADAEQTFLPILRQKRISAPITATTKQRTSEPVVQARDVTYHYGDGTLALKGVDLTLFRGEMLALLGPNGSGKTTFAKILAGIYQATRGRVQVFGQDIAQRKVRARLPQSVGYVFQNPDHQLFCRKVRDEIESGLKNLGMDARQRAIRVDETLEAVNLKHLADEDPLFLSKGERQRLAVAAVLAMGPDILVVDEPTTGQDSRSINGIMSLLCELREQGKTILIITHDMTLVAEYCQRVVAFRDGNVSFTGTPLELFADQTVLQRTGLQSPMSVALSARLQKEIPALPTLLTVAQWKMAFEGLQS